MPKPCYCNDPPMVLEPFIHNSYQDQTQLTVLKDRFVIPFNCLVRLRMTSLNSEKDIDQGLPDSCSIICEY